MLGHGFFMTSLGALAWILVGSMTADVVEDSQRKTGKRQEGLFFAGPALVQKSISGLGLMIKGVILTAVSFEATGTEVEKVVAIEKLAAVIVVLGIALPALSLWIFSKYQITQQLHERNLSALGYDEP